MKYTPFTVLLGIPFNYFILYVDAVTLVPTSIMVTTCPGQTVTFNCTAYGIPITWGVFTPNMNYTNLEISDANRKFVDGAIMAELVTTDVSTMPVTVVSSLTVNVTVELDGSKVQCAGFIDNGINIGIQSRTIHIIGNYYLLLDTSKMFSFC